MFTYPSALNAGAKRSGATCHMAMPQCCYLAKGAKRPSHTTNTIKFDRIPFDPCNSIKRFDLSPFDQKNSTYLQPPDIIKCHFALFSRICKSRNDPRNSIIVEKLFEKSNSENRDRKIKFRTFETENREMGCHSRIENDFLEISRTLNGGWSLRW